MAEDQFKVLRVYSGVVTTSFFKAHILLVGKHIRFSTEFTRTEMDNEVDLEKVFRPPCLAAVQKLGHGKIFEVL